MCAPVSLQVQKKRACVHAILPGCMREYTVYTVMGELHQILCRAPRTYGDTLPCTCAYTSKAPHTKRNPRKATHTRQRGWLHGVTRCSPSKVQYKKKHKKIIIKLTTAYFYSSPPIKTNQKKRRNSHIPKPRLRKRRGV